MKNQLLLFFSIVAILASCKKGDEDPFFTLASRKARLSGDWTLKSYAYNSVWINGSDTTISHSENGDGSSIKYTNDYYGFFFEDGNKTITEYTINIDKNGEWSRKIKFEFMQTNMSSGAITTITGDKTFETSGNWAFLKETKDVAKNKERVTFYILKEVETRGVETAVTEYPNTTFPDETEIVLAKTIQTTYDQGAEYLTYDILMLKSKEMKWYLTESSSQDGLIHISDQSISWVTK